MTMALRCGSSGLEAGTLLAVITVLFPGLPTQPRNRRFPGCVSVVLGYDLNQVDAQSVMILRLGACGNMDGRDSGIQEMGLSGGVVGKVNV